MIGQRFFRLIVLSQENDAVYSYGKYKRFLCQCDCGNQIIAFYSNLRRGATKSCGCWKKENNYNATRTHGMSQSPEYKIWAGIKKRCLNPRYKEFHLYGGRGITMSKEWESSFEQFFQDMGPRPSPSHSIERIDNNAGYNKDNCRWATKLEQGANTRRTHKITFNGEEMSVRQFAARINHSYFSVFNWHIRKHMSASEIVSKINSLSKP